MKKKVCYFFNKVTEKISFYFRVLCYSMSPRIRIITVSTLFFLFAGLNMFITCRGIYSIFEGDSKGSFIKVNHIEPLELPKNDSINNQLNKKFYEYK